jgi:hypothetical protein
VRRSLGGLALVTALVPAMLWGEASVSGPDRRDTERATSSPVRLPLHFVENAGQAAGLSWWNAARYREVWPGIDVGREERTAG